MDILSNKLLTLREDLSDLSNQKKEVQLKLTELDEYVSQILLVNESLVARLSGRPGIPGTERTTAWTPGISYPDSKVKHMSSSTYGTPSQMHTTSTSLSKRDSSLDHSLYRGAHAHEGSYIRDVTSTHRGYPKEQGTHASRGRNGATPRGEREGTLMSKRGAAQSQQQHSAHGRHDGVSDWLSEDSERERSNHVRAHGGDTPSSHITGLGTPIIASPYEYSSSKTVNSHHLAAPSYLKEQEFQDLNDQYHRIISNSKHAINGMDASYERELLRLMQKLHQKGEQLKAPKFQATY